MGKQINYYMEYESFVRLAEKALELGCEIIRNEHAAEIGRGFTIAPVTPDCKCYFFRVPKVGDITTGTDVNGKLYVNSWPSASGNALIEAGYSYISQKEKRISRARLYCATGYYNQNKEYIPRPECVTRIYNALARYAKKLAPYTEMTFTRTSYANETYLQEIEYKRKDYISEYCLQLNYSGYALC